MKASSITAVVLGIAMALGGCTDSSPARSSTFARSARITNRFLPLSKGGRWIYAGTNSGKQQLIEVAVTPAKKTVEWNGDAVASLVVRRRDWIDGMLVEQSHDYYAQKKDGSVWIMGERVDNYHRSELLGHGGSWLAGVDGAAPALVMPADARKDHAPITEDVIGLTDAHRYEVLSRTESAITPAGEVDNGLLLGAGDEGIRTKNLFAPGIGAVFSRSGSSEVRLTDRLPQDAESATIAEFSRPTVVDNPWFGVAGVDYRLYLGRDEGAPLRIEVAPTGTTKSVLWKGGRTETAESQFVATSDRGLLEVALDWFAQDDAGNVWYFGEDVYNYERGRVADKDGSWIAGADGPPGMIMPGDPGIGQRFNPENIPGNVFETVDVGSVNRSYRLGSGRTIGGVIQLHETLDDGSEEFKLYAPGYGEVRTMSPGTELVNLVYALPNDAIAARRPREIVTALRELRALSLRGRANLRVIRHSLARLEARHDAVPSILFRLGHEQLGALRRAVARGRTAAIRMRALDLEQTLLDIARLYRGGTAVELELIELHARRLRLAAEAADRSTAGSAAALAGAIALRSKNIVGERVMKRAAAAQTAAERGGLKEMIEAASDLLVAARAQSGSD